MLGSIYFGLFLVNKYFEKDVCLVHKLSLRIHFILSDIAMFDVLIDSVKSEYLHFL